MKDKNWKPVRVEIHGRAEKPVRNYKVTIGRAGERWGMDFTAALAHERQQHCWS